MYIEHIAIWTENIEIMKNFYTKYFGAVSGEKYENKGNGFSSYFLKFASGARLELMHMPGIPKTNDSAELQRTGLIHLAFKAGSEDMVVSLTERLRADGYPVESEPRKTGDGYFESCVFDPEKNRIEIVA